MDSQCSRRGLLRKPVRSIRARLLLWLLLVLCVAGILAALIIYRTAYQEASEVFDYHLKQIALTLRDQPFEDQDILGTLEEEAEYDFTIQVWNENRTKLYSSHAERILPPQSKPGYSYVEQTEGTWRVFVLSQDGLSIQVAQPMGVRQKRAARLALNTVLPFLILLPVMGVLIWIIVSKGLSPLNVLAQDLKQRDHTSLAPLSEQELPDELQPLVSELNHLLGRLSHALEAQRAFTADAAHELRTPLTALQLQVQLAERAPDDVARGQAFEFLKSGLRRGIHLVNQLLTLARNEPGVYVRQGKPTDLGQLVRQAAVEHAGIAQKKSVDLGVVRADKVSVMGDTEALLAMIGNVVGNAVRYTPPGGRIDLSVMATEEGPRVEVTDSGPGIPEAERERVFDRFYRGESASVDGETGSGIGLAIVKNVAQRHGATVTLHEPATGSGLVVRIQFPKQ
ncbi:MAG: two-component sensor histidine kinase [Betaproteobacteria bacterium]|nr:two-component sensor histidine kinase [Betaproteobacteria bacterium]